MDEELNLNGEQKVSNLVDELVTNAIDVRHKILPFEPGITHLSLIHI